MFINENICYKITSPVLKNYILNIYIVYDEWKGKIGIWNEYMEEKWSQIGNDMACEDVVGSKGEVLDSVPLTSWFLCPDQTHLLLCCPGHSCLDGQKSNSILSSRHTRVIPSQNTFQEWNLPKPLIHGNPGLFPLGNLPWHPNQNEHLFLWDLPYLCSAPLIWHWSHRDVHPWLPFCNDEKLNKRLPWWLRGQESACWCRRLQFDTWFGNIPWRRKWQPTPVFLSGKFHGQRSLEGHSPWGCKRVGHRIANKPQQQQTNKGTARAPPTTKPVPAHGLQPSRLLHPWDFPGKSTGVGCHCLLRWQT